MLEHLKVGIQGIGVVSCPSPSGRLSPHIFTNISMLGLLFYPENGGDSFIRSIGLLN
jgi:hypothetical protein